MTRRSAATLHYCIALACLGVMLNSMGWLLMLSAVLWIPVFVLHLYAIHHGTRDHPVFAKRLWVSTAGFLVFALARYDGGDTGGYTGLTSLLYRAGLLDSSFVAGWDSLQLVYLYLFFQLFIDLNILRAGARRNMAD